MSGRPDEQREWFWRDLMRRYDRRLRAYLRRARWNTEEIDEFVWDVWAMAVELEETLASSDDRWPLLSQLAARLSARRLRVRRRECSQGDRVAELMWASATTGESPGDAPAQQTWILYALRQLTEKQRFAVEYRYRWGWPYWAVAAAIGTEESTARVHAMRGIERLRGIARAFPPPRSP